MGEKRRSEQNRSEKKRKKDENKRKEGSEGTDGITQHQNEGKIRNHTVHMNRDMYSTHEIVFSK